MSDEPVDVIDAGEDPQRLEAPLPADEKGEPEPELTAEDYLLLDDLDNWVEGEASEPDPVELLDAVDEVTEKAANRMLRKLRRTRQEKAKIKAFADAEVKRVTGWRNDRVAGLERVDEFLERQLENITRQLIPPGAKRKQINLPNGVLKLTAPGQASLVVDDEAAALEWLDKNDYHDAIKTTTVVAVAELKKLASAVPFNADEVEGADPDMVHERVAIPTGETGEDGEPVLDIVPGVHFEKPAKDRFKADPK